MANPHFKVPELGTGQLARYIDHTLLAPDATLEQVEQYCDEAKEYNFKAVCVRMRHVTHAVERLRGSDVKVVCVVDFYFGLFSNNPGMGEALHAVSCGASELDISMNWTNFRTGTFSEVMHETYGRLRAIRLEIKPPIVLKLILETSGLDADGIVSIGKIAKDQGFEFVNTSTEHNGKVATQSNIARMRDAVGPDMGVKASDGVKTLKDCLDMIEAGASRIGTSIGVTIMKEEMMAVNDSVHAGDEVINRDGGA